MKETKFAVVIPTYQRGNGKSPDYLTRSLQCVFDQLYQNFTIFVIGDKYEDNAEFEDILNNFDRSKIISVNLTYAKERDAYQSMPEILWSYGGVHANNIGIEMAINHGYDYVAHLDDDDHWENTHLENFNKVIQETGAGFICSKANYTAGRVLPMDQTDHKYMLFVPQPCQVIHSSICVNFKRVDVRYRDLYAETGGKELPADAQLLLDIRNFLRKNNLVGVMVNSITCNHLEENRN
jgi:glycosyltransferase involved in cell wall biosynthesis